MTCKQDAPLRRWPLPFFPVLCFLVTTLPTLPCWGQIEAVSEGRHNLELGFTVSGRVLKRLVHPGDRVSANQLLVELDDKEGLSKIHIWKFRAASTVAIEQEQAKLEQARNEEKRTRELVAKHAAAPFELKRAELATRIQRLSLDKAKMEHEEAKLQLQIAQAEHDSYLLRTPLEGIVEEVRVEEGQVVQPLALAVRVVVTDPLWINARVPTAQTLHLKVNARAWIQPLLGERSSSLIQGKIIHIAQVVDSASDTRLVRIEYPNEAHAPAGGQVKVYFTKPAREVVSQAATKVSPESPSFSR